MVNGSVKYADGDFMIGDEPMSNNDQQRAPMIKGGRTFVPIGDRIEGRINAVAVWRRTHLICG